LQDVKKTQEGYPCLKAWFFLLMKLLCNTGMNLQNKDNQENYSDIRSDARKAIWTFLIINFCVAFLALGGERQFVLAAIFVQSALFFGFYLFFYIKFYLKNRDWFYQCSKHWRLIKT